MRPQMDRLRLVGIAGGVELFAPEDAYLSYCNSPYIGHRLGTSIDIYPAHNEWGGPVYSPCDGRVTIIRRIRMGHPRDDFPTAEDDYAIGIRPHVSTVADSFVRILHCRPTVIEGQEVCAGQDIGDSLRSRFFNFWTGPHAHVDVLRERDFVRSTQSFHVMLPVAEWTLSHSTPEEIELEIVRVCEAYAIATCHHTPIAHGKGLYAYAASDRDRGPIGALDAGFPHYLQGMIHKGSREYNNGSQFTLWGRTLGTVIGVSEHTVAFRTDSSVRLHLDQTPIRGLSLFLYSNRQLIHGSPPIVLVPVRYDGLSGISEGEIYCLHWTSSNH